MLHSVLMFDSSCFSSVSRHAVGLVFRFKSPVAQLILLVKLLNSHSKFVLGATRPSGRHQVLSSVTCRQQPTPKCRCHLPLWAKLICERRPVALCAPCQLCNVQEPCIALLCRNTGILCNRRQQHLVQQRVPR